MFARSKALHHFKLYFPLSLDKSLPPHLEYKTASNTCKLSTITILQLSAFPSAAFPNPPKTANFCTHHCWKLVLP